MKKDGVVRRLLQELDRWGVRGEVERARGSSHCWLTFTAGDRRVRYRTVVTQGHARAQANALADVRAELRRAGLSPPH